MQWSVVQSFLGVVLTGGGGQLENFQKCLFHEKWLTYVYMLDFEASLLLASNASLAVPKELLNESGHHVQAH